MKRTVKPKTLFGNMTAHTGVDSAGVFAQDLLSLGSVSTLPLASRTTSIAGRGPLMVQRNEGIVAGLDGMIPPSLNSTNPQPGGKSFAGSGGAGSFATITAKGAKG